MTRQNPYEPSRVPQSPGSDGSAETPAPLTARLIKLHLSVLAAAAVLCLMPLVIRIPWDMTLLHPLPLAAMLLMLASVAGSLVALVTLIGKGGSGGADRGGSGRRGLLRLTVFPVVHRHVWAGEPSRLVNRRCA